MSYLHAMTINDDNTSILTIFGLFTVEFIVLFLHIYSLRLNVKMI